MLLFIATIFLIGIRSQKANADRQLCRRMAVQRLAKNWGAGLLERLSPDRILRHGPHRAEIRSRKCSTLVHRRWPKTFVNPTQLCTIFPLQSLLSKCCCAVLRVVGVLLPFDAIFMLYTVKNPVHIRTHETNTYPNTQKYAHLVNTLTIDAARPTNTASTLAPAAHISWRLHASWCT